MVERTNGGGTSGSRMMALSDSFLPFARGTGPPRGPPPLRTLCLCIDYHTCSNCPNRERREGAGRCLCACAERPAARGCAGPEGTKVHALLRGVPERLAGVATARREAAAEAARTSRRVAPRAKGTQPRRGWQPRVARRPPKRRAHAGGLHPPWPRGGGCGEGASRATRCGRRSDAHMPAGCTPRGHEEEVVARVRAAGLAAAAEATRTGRRAAPRANGEGERVIPARQVQPGNPRGSPDPVSAAIAQPPGSRGRVAALRPVHH